MTLILLLARRASTEMTLILLLAWRAKAKAVSPFVYPANLAGVPDASCTRQTWPASLTPRVSGKLGRRP